MSNFLVGVALVVLFLLKAIAAVIATVFLLISIIDVFRWPEWFASVVDGVSGGLMDYIAVCLASFGTLIIDVFTIVPAIVATCSYRACGMYKRHIHFNNVRQYGKFWYNPNIRGAYWATFLLLLSDIPFILMSVATVVLFPWRILTLFAIYRGALCRGRNKCRARTEVFSNFLLGFADIFTALCAVLTVLSPLRAFYCWREVARRLTPFKFTALDDDVSFDGGEVRLILIQSGLLAAGPDLLAHLGWFLALPFVWNWRSLFAGMYCQVMAPNGAVLVTDGWMPRLLESPDFFLRGYIFALRGLLDVLLAPLFVLLLVTWRNVRMVRGIKKARAERQADAAAARTMSERLTRHAVRTYIELPKLAGIAQDEHTTADTMPRDETTVDQILAHVAYEAPMAHDYHFEARLVVLAQCGLLLSDLLFGFLFLLTIGLVLRAFFIIRRLRRVAYDPKAKGHSPLGWYECNYRRAIGIECAKSFIMILALPLLLILALTIYRIPVVLCVFRRTRDAWNERYKAMLANDALNKRALFAAALSSRSQPKAAAPAAMAPLLPDETSHERAETERDPAAAADNQPPLSEPVAQVDPPTAPTVPTAADDYEVDEEESERALFFSYAVIVMGQAVLVIVDILTVPLLLVVLVGLIRVHKQFREFFFYPPAEERNRGSLRRKSIALNAVFTLRDLFVTLVLWPLTLLVLPRFIIAVRNAKAAMRPPPDPVPALCLRHFAWSFREGFGWVLTVAGNFQGPPMAAVPDILALDVQGEEFWASVAQHFGGMKASIGRSLLPMTFTGTAAMVERIEPFPVPAAGRAREEGTNDTGASEDSNRPVCDFFATVTIETARVKRKTLVGLQGKVSMAAPLTIALLHNNSRSTFVSIHTTGAQLLAADRAGTPLPMGSTITANDAAIRAKAPPAPAATSAGSPSAAPPAGGARLASDWAPYFCDVWWFAVVTQFGQAAFDLFALLCAVFVHVNPVRALVLYHDLFYNARRQAQRTAAGDTRRFLKLYKQSNAQHTALLHAYERHLNEVHKTSAAARSDRNFLRIVEKSSLGSELRSFVESAKTIIGPSSFATPAVRDLCAQQVNNVLQACTTVGAHFFYQLDDLRRRSTSAPSGRDATFDDMDLFLRPSQEPRYTWATTGGVEDHGVNGTERSGGQSAGSVVRVEEALRYQQLPVTDVAAVRAWQVKDALAETTAWYVRALEAPEAEAKRAQPNNASKKKNKNKHKNKNNNNTSNSKHNTEYTLDSAEQPSMETMRAAVAAHLNTPEGFFTDDEIISAYASIIPTTQETSEGDPATHEEHNDNDNDEIDAEPSPSGSAADAIPEARPTDVQPSTNPLAQLQSAVTIPASGPAGGGPAELVEGELRRCQPLLTAEIEARLREEEAAAGALSFLALNLDWTQARIACVKHAARIFLDVLTLVALLPIIATVYRIPTLLHYALRRPRHWRWYILLVYGEMLLDVVFLVLYLICVASIVELIHVHQRMFYRFDRRLSIWSLREGILDALVDLAESAKGALKAMFRCRVLYNLIMAIVLCIVTPVELATNHLGLDHRRVLLCFPGWMATLVPWTGLIIFPFVIAYSIAPAHGLSDTDAALYAYYGLMLAVGVVCLGGMLRQAPSTRVVVPMRLLAVGGTLVAPFGLVLLEAAQLCALPLILSTGAGRLGASAGLRLPAGWDWVRQGAHYLYLDHVSRRHDDLPGTALVGDANAFPIGFWLSVAAMILIYIVASLPTVQQVLKDGGRSFATSVGWRRAVFAGNVLCLFISRNVVAFTQCAEHATFNATTTVITPAVGNLTNATAATVVQAYHRMTVGEDYLSVACWHEVPHTRRDGAFAVLLLCMFSVMIVLKGARWTSTAAEGWAGRGEGPADAEVQTSFHEVVDTVAVVLHTLLGALSGLLYRRPTAFCATQAALLLLVCALQCRNAPIVPALYPATALASVWQLNAVRNIGYLAAAGTAVWAAVASEHGGGPDTALPQRYLTALVVIWAVAAAAAVATVVIGYWYASKDDGFADWLDTLEETDAVVSALHAQGRFISCFDARTTHAEVRGARSLAALAEALTRLEAHVHVSAYTPLFYASRGLWLVQAARLKGRAVHRETLDTIAELLQSLRNGCFEHAMRREFSDI